MKIRGEGVGFEEARVLLKINTNTLVNGSYGYLNKTTYRLKTCLGKRLRLRLFLSSNLLESL